MKRKIEPYYVITWDFNKDQIERYNIMDYLISCYKATKKSKKLKTPETFDECKKFILDKSKEVKYAILDSTDELKDYYSVYRFNKVTINSDEIWLEYV